MQITPALCGYCALYGYCATDIVQMCGYCSLYGYCAADIVHCVDIVQQILCIAQCATELMRLNYNIGRVDIDDQAEITFPMASAHQQCLFASGHFSEQMKTLLVMNIFST